MNSILSSFCLPIVCVTFIEDDLDVMWPITLKYKAEVFHTT